MKKAIATAMCLFLGSVGAVHAQQSSVPRIHHSQLEPLDTDKSGAVSKGEYQTFMGQAFAQLDANSDKRLSQNELSSVVSQEQIVAMDTSRDGSVDQAEFMNQVMTDFSTSDSDGDGQLPLKP
ncbi:EF-hand domain-containing protein [Bordetella sp. BOR01]|uniref:EF-hand domain-containing protein n=1 Tax=Bordetella sp. BOR01 TaxID=2854779 RepID=UPI001C47D494|nr:EF-hand domain-containing protein [Bordetella sp. BOR01]MBV7483098.1 EF-hand domain-containing protein [Bordetella sp. BOR01]